jgi:hypothetical protein
VVFTHAPRCKPGLRPEFEICQANKHITVHGNINGNSTKAEINDDSSSDNIHASYGIDSHNSVNADRNSNANIINDNISAGRGMNQ